MVPRPLMTLTLLLEAGRSSLQFGVSNCMGGHSLQTVPGGPVEAGPLVGWAVLYEQTWIGQLGGTHIDSIGQQVHPVHAGQLATGQESGGVGKQILQSREQCY